VLVVLHIQIDGVRRHGKYSTIVRRSCLIYSYYNTRGVLFQAFFVLRKKDNQISLLHLYHHSLTPIETWICVKFIAGKCATLFRICSRVRKSYNFVCRVPPTQKMTLTQFEPCRASGKSRNADSF